MGFFDSFLDTASSAFNWLGNNKTALDMISGAAKGYGTYMQYKQNKDAANLQKQQMKQAQSQYEQSLAFQKQQYEDEQRRIKDNTAAPSAYNNALPMSSFEAGSLLSGNMADAMKKGAM